MNLRGPTNRGVIERRVLVNFRGPTAVLQGVLPPPFRVQDVGGFGIAGICLIRLAQVRPRMLPKALGLRSKNAAHRIAVEWDTQEGVQRGVFIPRRDTSSLLNRLAGGRLFPGVHRAAKFAVEESEQTVAIALDSCDGSTHVHVAGRVAEQMPAGSVFGSVAAASSWFADPQRFPPGSVAFDSALLMRDIPHLWRAHRPLRVGETADAGSS